MADIPIFRPSIPQGRTTSAPSLVPAESARRMELERTRLFEGLARELIGVYQKQERKAERAKEDLYVARLQSDISQRLSDLAFNNSDPTEYIKKARAYTDGVISNMPDKFKANFLRSAESSIMSTYTKKRNVIAQNIARESEQALSSSEKLLTKLYEDSGLATTEADKLYQQELLLQLTDNLNRQKELRKQGIPEENKEILDSIDREFALRMESISRNQRTTALVSYASGTDEPALALIQLKEEGKLSDFGVGQREFESALGRIQTLDNEKEQQRANARRKESADRKILQTEVSRRLMESNDVEEKQLLEKTLMASATSVTELYKFQQIIEDSKENYKELEDNPLLLDKAQLLLSVGKYDELNSFLEEKTNRGISAKTKFKIQRQAEEFIKFMANSKEAQMLDQVLKMNYPILTNNIINVDEIAPINARNANIHKIGMSALYDRIRSGEVNTSDEIKQASDQILNTISRAIPNSNKADREFNPSELEVSLMTPFEKERFIKLRNLRPTIEKYKKQYKDPERFMDQYLTLPQNDGLSDRELAIIRQQIDNAR